MAQKIREENNTRDRESLSFKIEEHFLEDPDNEKVVIHLMLSHLLLSAFNYGMCICVICVYM